MKIWKGQHCNNITITWNISFVHIEKHVMGHLKGQRYFNSLIIMCPC